jgi:hypothetical protein
MLEDTSIQTGRTLLEAVQEMRETGISAFVRIRDIGRIEVNEIKPIESNSIVATIYSWSSDEFPSEMWIVPLSAVQAIEVSERLEPCSPAITLLDVS